MKKFIFLFLFAMIGLSTVRAETNPQAKDVQVNTSSFSKNLNSTDNTVQKALNTIDQTAGSGGGSSPVGPTGTVQTNGGSGNLGAFAGSTCGSQIAYSISASGVLGCVPYLSLASFSASSPITYNNSTGAFGWTNSLNYITLTALNSTMLGLTYNNATGNFSLTSGYYFPTTSDQTAWNAKQAAGNYITALTGDGTASGPGSSALTLATVNSNVGSYTNANITVNAKGLVTAASNGTPGGVTSLSSNDGTITVSASTGAVALSRPAITGDVAIAGGGNSSVLATVNSNVGTFQGLTVNGKGLVTAASNQNYLTGNQTITASGDATGSGTTSLPLTLATVNSNVGTFQGITINGKGLVTAATNQNYLTSDLWTASGGNVYRPTGNVGIGSATPGQALDVQGTVRTTGLYVSGLTANRPMATTTNGQTITGTYSGTSSTTVVTTTGSLVPGDYFKIDPAGSGNAVDGGTGITPAAGSTTYVQYNNAGNFAGSSNFVFTGGNVGLGSITPGQRLDVQGTVRSTALTMSTGAVTGYVLTASDSAGDTSWGPAGAGTTGTSMLFGNGSGGYTNVTNTAVSGGNVGIGTTTALNQTLTVQGSILVQGGAAPFYITGVNVGIGSANPGQLLDVQGTIRSDATGNAIFNGNVGIGTALPGQALDVNGTAARFRSPNNSTWSCGPNNSGNWVCTSP